MNQTNLEQQWIDKAQLGDKEAFANLFHMHYSFLYKYLFKVTMNHELSEDLIQETMLRAYQNIRRFNGQSKFSSWLITIATRLYIDVIRKRKSEETWRKQKQLMLSQQLNEKKQTDTLQWLAVMDVMATIEADVRLAILLKHYYGFSYDEVAAMLKIKTGTAKSKVHYGLQKLRKEWKTDGTKRK